ncbi:MAG: phosphatidylserine decarboxylase [Bacteroidales bacterium]
MQIDRAGAPFIAGALVPAAALTMLKRPGWALPFAALAGFLAFFFRDPDRVTPVDPDAVIAPADGRVIVAGAPEAEGAPPGCWRQISIFLSPLDVHINRSPVAARTVRVDYRPGRYLPAYKAGAGVENERNEIWLDRDGEPVVCRQITGVLVRRVVCRLNAGDRVQAGERLGLMKFGSRFDVFLPERADVLVRVGEHVRAGETIVARLSRL